MMLQRFLRDRRAAVAPAFAAAVIPIFGLLGAAVDYTRASAARTSMQSALDSTALALSKDAPNLTPAQLQANASSYFTALLNRPEVQGVAVTATYSTGTGSQLTLAASGAVKTLFMAMWPFNVPEMSVGASSTSTWGMTRLRVALVLDNTGSMSSDGKMTALKKATKNLLTELKKAATKDGDVYVSIIPFAKDVNAGSSNYQESWIDWDDWEDRNGTCSKSSYSSSKSNCQSHSGTWTPKNHNTWNGCVTDRDQNYDTMNTAPGAGALFPAEQHSACPTSLIPLSYDWAALNGKVDAMTPTGNTNVTIGLQWGWQSLTQGAPLYAPAEDPNYKYENVIILLTDGQNTQNRWSTNQSSIDARTQKTCDNIKAAKPKPDDIKVYTVLVMEGNQTLLKSCATDASKYFYLTSADQIIATFDAIGTNLSRLRIAQ